MIFDIIKQCAAEMGLKKTDQPAYLQALLRYASVSKAAQTLRCDTGDAGPCL
jgi:hypothetical protein